MQQKYFRYPWAVAGDLQAGGIPDPTQSSGYVSYQSGWTFDYQRNLQTDDNAKSIQRVSDNSLYNDITTNLQNYQQFGTPEWITSANNGGTPFPYGKGAFVRYSSSGNAPFDVYFSTVANNTSVPGADSNWIDITSLFTKYLTLSATLNLYVSPAGSDSNNGLSSGTPFLTLQKAWNTIFNNYNLNLQNVVVNMAAGTYGPFVASGAPNGYGPGISITFTGAATSTTIISGTTAVGAVSVGSGARVSMRNCTINGINGLVATSGGEIDIDSTVALGVCSAVQLKANGGVITIGNGFSVTGSAAACIYADSYGLVETIAAAVVTLTGTPAFSTGFAQVIGGQIFLPNTFTFSGGATGPRFASSGGGFINTNGGGVNFFPGDSAGSTGSGTNIGFYA